MAYKTEIRYNSNSFKHGMSGHRLYYTWQRMKSRCGNPNNSDYADYGGRGILVEDPWSYSFQEFYKDMAPTYQEGMELDRIDVNGNYSSSNCKWSTEQEQAWNQRTYKSNKSGKSGVTWNKKGSRWEARISKDSVEYYLGSYSDMFDAIRARELAELDLYGAIKNKFTFPEDISN